MAEPNEATVHDVRIRIDRTLCVGFGDCVSAAPDAFQLDGEEIAIFVQPETVSRERLLEACESCPVDALTAWDADGVQIVP